MSKKPRRVAEPSAGGESPGSENPGTGPLPAVREQAPGRLFAAAELPWLGALWVAAVLFFWPVLFGHQSLYFRDTLSYYYPAANLTAAAWRAGEIPLWEPGVGLGYPYLADPHSMVFYPLTALLLLLPFPLAYNLFVAVHVPLAGTFLFLLLRRWQLSRPAAALGAGVAMFCGFTVSALSLTTILRGFAWTPAVLLAFDGFLAGRGWRAVVAAALVLAIEGGSTDPHYALFTGFFILVLPWLRPLPCRVSARRALVGGLATGLLACALLSYQYLPLGELLLWSDRSQGLGELEVCAFHVEPVNLLNAVLPVSFPDPGSPYWLASYPAAALPFIPDIHWGILVLALAAAAFGWAVAPGRPGPACAEDGAAPEPDDSDGEDEPAGGPLVSARFGRTAVLCGLIAFAGAALSLGYHLPFHDWLMALIPPLKAFRYPAKYLFLTAMALAILAALGFEALRARRPAGLRLFGTLLSATAAATLVARIALHLSRVDFPSEFLGDALLSRPDIRELQEAMWLRWSSNLSMVLGLAVIARLLLWMFASGRLRPRTFLAAVGFWAVGSLAITTFRSYPTAPNEYWTQPPPSAAVLEHPGPGEPPIRYVQPVQVNYEFLTGRTALEQQTAQRAMMMSLYGTMYGLAPLLECLSVRLATHGQFVLLATGVGSETAVKLAAAAGGRYLFRFARVSGDRSFGTPICRDQSLLVEEFDGVSPRAFIPARAAVASPGARLPTTTAVLDLPRQALYESVDALGRVVPTAGVELAPRAVRRCALRHYGRQSLTVDFDVEGSGLLVVLDAFYPGWKARVDGRERPIVRVAGLFRGVEVTGGEHTLEMTYEPASFRLGASVSVLALIFCLGVWRRAKRRNEPPISP